MARKIDIDPIGRLAPYVQAANAVESLIRSGEISVDARITEAELMAWTEMARSTVRRTLQLLRERGLIETVDNRGSYVLGSEAWADNSSGHG